MALELSDLMPTDEQIARLNADNIEKAIVIMRKVRDRRDIKFDITSTIDIPIGKSLHDVTEENFCGTVVCMAGALCVMPDGPRDHLQPSSRITTGTVLALRDASAWLGINDYARGDLESGEADIAEWLFMPSSYDDTRDIDEAINRLEQLLVVARARP